MEIFNQKFRKNDYELPYEGDIKLLEKLVKLSRKYRGNIFRGGLVFVDKNNQIVINKFKEYIKREIL